MSSYGRLFEIVYRHASPIQSGFIYIIHIDIYTNIYINIVCELQVPTQFQCIIAFEKMNVERNVDVVPWQGTNRD